MRPTAGKVLVADHETHRHGGADALARAGVCSIPEGRGIFPNLTVRENLLIWTYQGKVRLPEVEERAYARFPKLGQRRKQVAGTLSGGEQQMLAFARALVGNPRVLLLDEISMGLAPLIVAELYEVVGQLAAEGITILLVEQFIQTAVAVATRAAIVVHGRVEREGSPAEIAAEAAEHYLAGSGG
jgi:branched-chain amino acid transport system ATP-binding protein